MKTISVKSFTTRHNVIIPITVTTTVTDGIGIHLTGVSDREVKEILLRAVTAMQAAGYHVPGKKLIISIKADDGRPVFGNVSNLDLPVAVSILAASGEIPVTQEFLDNFTIIGELGLDGSVRRAHSLLATLPVNGKVIMPADDNDSQEGNIFPILNITEIENVFFPF